jgi:ribosome silencing factor RsfS/YbeB/iojap
LATTQKRAPARKSATPKAAQAPATRRSSPAARTPAAKKPAAKKAPVAKKAPASRSAVAKKAAPAKKAPPRSGKAVAQAGPAKVPRSAKPKVAKVLDAAARLRKLVLDALDDLKARDITEIDVRGKSGVTDLLVIASGTSSRHVKSIADDVVKQATRAGLPPIGVEGQREAEWVLVDLGDVIVHVMLPRTREFYGLERLWTVGDSEAEMLAG